MAESPARLNVHQHKDIAVVEFTENKILDEMSVAEIERTVREGALMPPKSTFFTPKLRTGLVLRPLD